MIDAILKETVSRNQQFGDKVPDFTKEGIREYLFDSTTVFGDKIPDFSQNKPTSMASGEMAGVTLDSSFIYCMNGTKQENDDQGRVYKVDGKLQPNCEYEINGYIYKTDDNGRIVEASGTLKLKGEPRQPLNEQGIGGEDKRESDDRGHLIADRFGGSNKNENLVAQDSNLNRGAYKAIENECADALEQGKEVTITVEVEYEGDSERPSRFIVTYTIDGETNEKVFLNERQGG